MEKTQGFYQLDNTTLKFDVIKDIEKIQLNHMLMQKENFTRLKGDLPKGYFNTSIHEVSEALNITRNKATRLLKEFIDLDIITMVKRGTSKNTLSIYKYNSVTTTEELEVEVKPNPSNDTPPEGTKAPKTKTTQEDQTTPEVTTTEAVPVTAPDYFEYNFSECGIMKKLDMCEKKGIVLNCDKNDTKAMDTLKGMDEFILRPCLDVAYLKGKSTVEYVLGIYHNKGGIVDIEREKAFYEQELEEQRKRIEARRLQEQLKELKAQTELNAQFVANTQDTQEAQDIQDVQVEAEAQDVQDTQGVQEVQVDEVATVESQEQSQNQSYPIDTKTGLPVYPNTSPNFNFIRDCIGYTTYIDILEGKGHLLDTNVNLAKHYAKYYQVDTTVIDQAYAEDRVVSRG